MNMRSVCIYLCVLLSATCVLCQVTLLETGPGAVKPSETLRLSCKVTGYSISSGYCWYWVRQPPGKGLEWLGGICYDGRIYLAENLKSRLSTSKDNGKNEFYLEMRGMAAEDTATYYGVRTILGYGNYFDIWGSGTFVAVTSAEPSKPSVFPLVPCCRTGSKTDIPIGCLATGFLPQPVEVTWNAGSPITSGVKTFPAVLRSNTGLFSQSSYLSVTASEWKTKSYQCLVKHSPTSSQLSITVKNKANDSLTLNGSLPLIPQIQLLMDVSCNKRKREKFVCFGYDLPNIPGMKVSWLLDGSVKSTITPSSKKPFELYEIKQFKSNDWKESVECVLTVPGKGTYYSKVSDCKEGNKRTRRTNPAITIAP